ncbi:MAG TPA: HDIG domain-containing protein [candidate division WOR-3 bacterium]|uniref:HDIG domain-containing protein n=1 Tax=candidate division WOR-3 bacterium TaxID=2052148 RepID=A0A9C9EKZ6_UNCW3|nr:HDIG domain-containing protein [candidate division WOR-3 bacterium]
MKKRDIYKLLPEIKWIKDKKIREGVADTWLLAVKKGGWKKIDRIPFTLLIKTKKTLIEHTRCITRMAVAVATVQKGFNFDVVVAGGLVHDVGKLLEYEKRGNKVVKSKYGERIRHPVAGYALALEAGLPLEIAHIIAAHSSEGEKVRRSREAILINHCDFIDFDIAKADN